jgi:hypothetical protein
MSKIDERNAETREMRATPNEHSSELKPTFARVLRGYGPLVAFAVLFAMMAILLPTTIRSSGSLSDNDNSLASEPLPTAAPQTRQGAKGQAAVAGTAGSSRTVGGALPPAKGSCPGQPQQVPGDPYSPPCVTFSGSNGGVTSRGVTSNEIKVAFRVLNEKGFDQTLAALAGAKITDTPEDVQRTVTAYEEYFNKHFQFYGRKMKIYFYPGKGSSTTELLGGGQAEAQADAIHVAQEIKAFAEMNGATAPFTDALARQKTLAFGTPYLSSKWHLDHRPWNWSIATDCTIVAQTAGEYYVNLLAGKNADYAGDGIKGKPRKLAGLSPENPWYAECHKDFEQVIQKGTGKKVPVHINYRLDINSMSNQAANVIAQLKSQQATTIFCGCDPIFPVFLTTKASEQNYNPEWVVVGVALTDHDLVGQLYDQDQWSHAAGVSYAGDVIPQRAGIGYAAYKTIRKDEPAFAAELIYAQMYMLALGIQLAGPNLTPYSFERGMFTYPGGHGMYGTWGFNPGEYTPTRDARIIWWDPEKISSFNNKKGAYIDGYGGRRFALHHLPKGTPDIFNK